jgi:rfaE bifunctional protein nucleotidyltransferase chain/domain
VPKIKHSRKPAAAKSSKLKTLTELAAIIEKARKGGKSVVHCHGVFDLVHPGHIVHFREARAKGDLLVVTITPDKWVNKGPGRPLFTEKLRLDSLAALEMIDYVALNEWPTAVETINKLKPTFYVKGSDYADAKADVTGKIAEEQAAVEAHGGKLVFTEGFTSSSSHLINRLFSAYPLETQEYLQGLRSLHSADRILSYLRGLSKVKALVTGEAILDQYSYCSALGKTTKETIVATKFTHEELFAGGAVATANHMAGFCGEVTLLTNLGPDPKEEGFVRSKLKPNVRLEIVRTPDRPTVRKQRFVDPEQLRKVFEVQYLDDTPISGDVEAAAARMFDRECARHDLVVVNDFGHGLMTPKLRKQAAGCGKFLALNTQTNAANQGFNAITGYTRADYVAIDEQELRVATRDKYGRIPDLAQRVKDELKTGTFLVSRGAAGAVALTDDGWHDAPALARRIVDRVGAGDALFAVTSPCAYKRVPPDVLTFVGNCVGALAVEIVGNRESVNPVSLFKFIETLLK